MSDVIPWSLEWSVTIRIQGDKFRVVEPLTEIPFATHAI